MLQGVHISRENPEGGASYCSKLFFCWLLPLVKASTKKFLSVEDLYQPSAYDLAEPLGNKLEYHWEMEKLLARENRRQPSLGRAIKATFKWSFIYLGTLIFAHVVLLRTLMVLVIWDFVYMVNHITYGTYSKYSIYIPVLLLLVVLSSVLNILLWHHNSIGCFRIGYRCRVACSSLIYRKLLKLSVNSIHSTQLEEVMHLLTVQVLKFERFSMYFHYLWVFPCQLAFLGVIMYIVTDGFIPVAISLGLCFAILTIYYLFAGFVLKWQNRSREYKVQRNTILLECLDNIKLIKMYACEALYERNMAAIRKKELRAIAMKLYLFANGCVFFFGLSNIALLAILLAMYFGGERLHSEKVYVVLQCLTTLELFITARLPYAIETLIETRQAIKRIQQFIELPEKLYFADAPPRGKKTGYVHLNDCTASWWLEGSSYTLADINLEFVPGCLYLIMGDRLSGKSSFLQLVLNEIPMIKGKVQKIGSMSYSSQDPWLFKATIRQNILFGDQLFGEHYKQVIKVCGVLPDLKTYPFGDKTIVNEQIMLDEGQKARINLARAVYRDADIYILDEPFRNIEPGLSRHLYERCLVAHLGDKTRIMATQHKGFLDKADFIVILRKGRIISVTTYEALPFELLPKLYPIEDGRDSEASSQITLGSGGGTESEDEYYDYGFVKNELRFTLYKNYLTMFIPKILNAFYFILAVITTISFPLTKSWLMYIISSGEYKVKYNASVNPFDFIVPRNMKIVPAKTNKFEITIYFFMAGLAIILFGLHAIIFIKMRMFSAKRFHEMAFRNVVHSPMQFFRGSPQAAITNRFLKDTHGVDELLPKELFITMMTSSFVAASVTTVSVLYPLSLVVFVCLGVGIYLIRKIYIGISNDMIHLEAKARLGLWSHIAATFQGITTIRSYKAEYLTTKEFDQLQDTGTPPIVTQALLDKTMGFYIDLVMIILIIAVMLQSIFRLTYLSLFSKLAASGAVFGFVITETFYLIGNLQFGLRASIKVMSDVYNVQKLLHYINLETEFPIKETKVSNTLQTWPDTGAIEFIRIYQIYTIGEGDELYNFNLVVEASEKVALIGHVGSGATAVPIALFNVDKALGQILIDNVDIDSVHTHYLRRKLSIIPKESVLFTGTIRNNIDLRQEHSDLEVWRVLDKIDLKDSVTNLNMDIRKMHLSYDDVVLINWARALLTNKKILVIEDSNIRLEERTTEMIMSMLEVDFRHKTILMVTNRLCMIEKCNTVVIFKDGKVIEQGPARQFIDDDQGPLNQYLVTKDEPPPVEERSRTRISSKLAKRTMSVNNNKESDA